MTELSANYVIIPAAGSLVGPLPGIPDDANVATRIVDRILKEHGARRMSKTEYWEVEWALGTQSGRLECATEEEAETASRQLQLDFYPQSNWTITARLVRK
jgi:hypothetical protein